MATLATYQNVANDGRRVRLTKNDRLVMTALEEAGAPLKAYDLLERLKAQGIGAPMTVYRALDRLQKQGLVHKLDGLGAFVVCKHGEPHNVEIFLVCHNCDYAEEVYEVDATIEQLAREVAAKHEFDASLVRMEIRGQCRKGNDCPGRSSGPKLS